MKKAIVTICLLSTCLSYFANAQPSCNLKITDTSEVGVIENGKEKVIEVNAESVVGLNDILISSSKYHKNFAVVQLSTFIVDGKLSNFGIRDEIRNIFVKGAISDDGKKATVSYTVGGILDGFTENTRIEGSCDLSDDK